MHTHGTGRPQREVNPIASEHLAVLVRHYGYIGLSGLLMLGIVGLPIPDETLLTAVGFLVGQGQLALFPSVVAGVVGSCAGITVSFGLGRLLGRPALLGIGRWVHLTPQRLDQAQKYFERFGGIFVVIGFFIPGVRHLTAIAAGLSAMSWGRFASIAYAGACVWVCVFVLLGRTFGRHASLALPYGIWPALAGLAVALAVLALIWFARARLWTKRHR